MTQAVPANMCGADVATIPATRSHIRLNTANGYGSTNTRIRRFTNTVVNQGTDITYADSATLGASFTINTTGVYAIFYTDQYSAASDLGLSKNTTTPTTSIQSIALSELLNAVTTAGANLGACCPWTGPLTAGDVIRPHAAAGSTGTNVNEVLFTITRIL